jgi:hypothetical protein
MEAPIVVAGRVIRIDATSQIAAVDLPQRPDIRKVRLKIAQIVIDGVLRGQLQGNHIAAYYWAPEEFGSGLSQLNLQRVGSNAVHYLFADGRSLRYFTDVFRSQTYVYSGLHEARSGGKDLQAEIVRILLTPGRQFDRKLFLDTLFTSTGTALQLAGYSEVLPFLRALQTAGDSEISTRACVALHEFAFLGQDACFDDLVKRGVPAAVAKSEAETSSRSTFKDRIRHNILREPLSVASAYAVLPGRQGILDFLHLLQLHPDREIAGRATSALQALGNR